MQKIIKTLYLTFLFFITFSLTAQDTGDSNSNAKKVYLFGGIGPAIPLGSFGDERDPGFDLNTAISYNFTENLFVRGMFDFSNFNFEKGAISQTLGPVSNNTFDVGGSNNLISLLVSGGYAVTTGRLSPYIFAGAGVSFVSRPVLEFTQNSVDVETEISGHFSHVTGLGIDFILNPVKDGEEENASSTTYIIYFESFHTRIPEDTELSVHEFNLLTFNIGIKTSF